MIKPNDDRPRLFVDIDGTLAEWRHITLKIDCAEDKNLVIDKLYQILTQKGYYSSLYPQQNVVDAVNSLIDKYEVFIVSCYPEKVKENEADTTPKEEKREWLKTYTPSIDDSHIIFVPDGEDKTKYIPEGVKSTDFLLDDYSKNLKDWAQAGGVGIKLMNELNGQHKTWNGACVNKDYSAKTIASGIENVMLGIENTKHLEPRKNRESYLEIDKDTVIEF